MSHATLGSVSHELLWLQRIRDLSQRLSVREALEDLPREILDAAIELTDAERGFLVLVEGVKPDGTPKTRVACARGFDGAALRGPQVKVSRTVVRRVLERGSGLVTSSEAEDRDVLQASSVLSSRVRSIACVPLLLKDETLGVLYLDHRFLESAFSADDLPLLEVFAAQSGLALRWAQTRAEQEKRQAALATELASLRERTPGSKSPEPTQRSLTRYGELVGGSPPMLALYGEIERATHGDGAVLLLGEPGCGLTLTARELHRRSRAEGEPFVVQTAALPGHELRDALFGTASSPGAFERAGAGTLVIDDVEQLTPDLQVRIVQVLKTHTWPGLSGPIPLACRVLACSHQNLRALALEGLVREDLYYRLDAHRLVVPPLRQRRGDLEALIKHLQPRAFSVSAKARQLMEGYSWPGNVRELSNEVRRLAGLGREVVLDDLSLEIQTGERRLSDSPALTLDQIEAHAVRDALERSGNNKARAARELGVPRSTLYHLLDRHGLR